MNSFRALEYFTDWPLVLAFVVIFSLAIALLASMSQSAIYHKRQTILLARLRRRLVATLGTYAPSDAEALTEGEPS